MHLVFAAGVIIAASTPAGRADRAEQVGSVVAIVAHHGRPRAGRRPDISVRTFLSDRGLVLKPKLDRRAGGAAAKYLFQQRAEVYGMACPLLSSR